MTNALLQASFVASFSSVGISDGSAYLQWGNSQIFQVTGLTSVGNLPTTASTRFGGVASTTSVLCAYSATVSVGDTLAFPAVGSTIFVTYVTPNGSAGSNIMRETPIRVT